MQEKKAIGVFDSGFGGLTILKELVKKMPQYDYIYLGDNARAPYGNRSFDTVYKYTLDAVHKLFELNCELIILACNTASAKALRTIQQHDLPNIDANKRVLGVIRPTTEIIGKYTTSNNVGILGTQGTIQSNSYKIEIEKFFPAIKVWQKACPMWVPLIENGEYETEGADYFVQKYINELLAQSPSIDAIILACTHYPLLLAKIKQYLPAHITVLTQGEIVAESLFTYLQKHENMEKKLSTNATQHFYTSDMPEQFNELASIFFENKIEAKKINF